MDTTVRFNRWIFIFTAVITALSNVIFLFTFRISTCSPNVCDRPGRPEATVTKQPDFSLLTSGRSKVQRGGWLSTDRVQLLLQGLDLRLHRPHELLHLLVAADGTAGRSWRGSTRSDEVGIPKPRVRPHGGPHSLPASSSFSSLSLSFLPSFFSFCNDINRGHKTTLNKKKKFKRSIRNVAFFEQPPSYLGTR